jgi:hypothetical protein
MVNSEVVLNLFWNLLFLKAVVESGSENMLFSLI